MNWDWIKDQFDEYSRVARLYPAIFTAAPLIWSAIVLFPSLLASPGDTLATVLVVACFLYFVSSVARSQGRYIEPRLIAVWGGWPTTIALRHRDDAFDRYTKARYHAALGVLCPDLTFPTPAQEAADPDMADDIYRSATRKLIEVARKAENRLVRAENASYGFRRNLLGLKPIGLSSALAAGLLTGAMWWLRLAQPVTFTTVRKSTVTYPYLPVMIAADIGYAVLWLFIVRRHFVRQAGDDYAAALLKTLDAPSAGDTSSA